MTNQEAFAAHEVRVFKMLAEAGFAPSTIYDIGAANGTWSALISEVFPQAVFHMFEPLAKLKQSFTESLSWHMQNHPAFCLHEVALGADCRPVSMCVHENGYSSTTLEMGAHPEYQTRMTVPQYTLDTYVRNGRLPLPDLIKLDTQGAERAILGHSIQCLEHASLIFAETWFYRGYGPQTPVITELGDLLELHDFHLAELGYRFYDDNHRLYGCDAFYLKRSLLDRVAAKMPNGPW